MADHAQTRPLTALLAAATAILAIAVVLLAWWVIYGKPPTPPPNGLDPETIAEAVSKRLEQDGYLKKDHFDQRMDGLDDAVSSLLKAEDFDRGLAELKRALAACCGNTPNPPPVGSRPLQPRIWVMFDNARLNEDERLTAESHGIAISGPQIVRLDSLRRALLACASPEQPVRLRIQGYSSTRDFVNDEGKPLRGSKALNLQAANLRAEVVRAHLLADPDANDRVEILHDPWQELTDIRRPFLDSHEEIESTDHELLNRTVLVAVLDAGKCAVGAAGGGNTR